MSYSYDGCGQPADEGRQRPGDAVPVQRRQRTGLADTAERRADETSSYDAAATCLWKALAERLTTYAWDGENRLTSVAAVSGTETYAYCADGLREKKVTASGTTYYLRDVENVLNELNASLVATARYVGYPGKWGGLVSERVPGVSKFSRDFQGNARALLSAAGAITDSYLYRAFGEEVAVKRGDCQPVPRVRAWTTTGTTRRDCTCRPGT